MIKASIIIPTRDRDIWLNKAIQSFIRQNYLSSEYEILVVDNGSSDDTREITENTTACTPTHNIKYLYEPEPGLLSGRHGGALQARGDILIFVDDDVEAVSGWLSAIIEAFNDPKVHLVGGPSLPTFELEPPAWIKKYWIKIDDRIICGPLSISYMKNGKREIDPGLVWGLNFAIRKTTLFDLGGFHPDCIPKSLQHFQGDGETGLTRKAKEKNLKAAYAPGALVYHNIPKERLTVSYFEERNYYQGVCDSYTLIRQNKGLDRCNLPKYCSNDHHTPHLSSYDQYKQIIYDRIHNAYVDGFLFHQEAVKKSEILLKWVLRDSYLFDYALPEI
jgi:glycosyltransferase involved in cell wall biosynthesis